MKLINALRFCRECLLLGKNCLGGIAAFAASGHLNAFYSWHMHCSCKGERGHENPPTMQKQGVCVMKTLFLALMAGLMFVNLPIARADGSHDQMISMNDAYIPNNFDTSSDAFVVVNGMFPNSCYRFKEAKVDHISPTLHEVRAYATVTEGLCLMVLVPFQKEVQLGKLVAGDHAIHFVNGDGTYWEKHLTIGN
jgi:hypothetical protein